MSVKQKKTKPNFVEAAKKFKKTQSAGVERKEIKTRQIAIRFNPSDYRAVEEKAKHAGITVTDYMRECVLSGEVVDNKPAELLAHLETEKLFLLSKMSNNLNQIARYCNIYKSTDISVLNYLKQIQQSAFSLIRKNTGQIKKVS
ncbi:MAG: hypothetical protein C0602_08535 [Denitrovibrio sp.]|nr:MAG: hypothetical protein C0602_08535 [Denitrovibrio sp.]